MAKKQRTADEAREIDEAVVAAVRQNWATSLQYLLDMERMFDSDTRRLFELVRIHVDSRLADRSNPAKFNEFQLYARAFIRALFAHIEGVTYLMRQVVLWAHGRGELSLTETEISSLSDGELPAGGKRRFNSMKENFSLAFEYLPKIFGSPYVLSRQGADWSRFCASIEVRDAITHPKTTAQFQISGDAIREAQLVACWFNESLRALLKSCSDDALKSGRPLH